MCVSVLPALPGESSLPLSGTPPASVQHLPLEDPSYLERSFVCRFRCLLDNSSGFLVTILSLQGQDSQNQYVSLLRWNTAQGLGLASSPPQEGSAGLRLTNISEGQPVEDAVVFRNFLCLVKTWDMFT